MHPQQRTENGYKLSNLNVSEIEEYLTINQSLIIPLGGLEPFGNIGAVGIPGMCIEAIAIELALRCNSLVAPQLPFASSPLFKAFPGCVSMGSNSYENVLSYLCSGFLYQGFKRVLLLQSVLMPDNALKGVLKRLEKYKDAGKVRLFSWQNDKRIIDFLHKESAATSFERQDTGLLSLAAFLDPVHHRNTAFSATFGEITQTQYKTWCKRGADPHKFKKLFPSGLTLKKDSIQPSSDLGNRLFQYILNCMISDYSEFLKADTVNVAQ